MTTSTVTNDPDTLARVWREFHSRVPVKIGTIKDDRRDRAMAKVLNQLIDEIGNRDTNV